LEAILIKISNNAESGIADENYCYFVTTELTIISHSKVTQHTRDLYQGQNKRILFRRGEYLIHTELKILIFDFQITYQPSILFSN
jgi:hypothetical protein